MLNTTEAVKDRALVTKYRNPHIKEFLVCERADEDDIIVFGSSVLSKKLLGHCLSRGLLLRSSYFKFLFRKGLTETQCINSAARQWRELTENAISILLSEIERIEKEGLGIVRIIL